MIAALKRKRFLRERGDRPDLRLERLSVISIRL
jgi:hypothetical protein